MTPPQLSTAIENALIALAVLVPLVSLAPLIGCVEGWPRWRRLLLTPVAVAALVVLAVAILYHAEWVDYRRAVGR